MIHSDETADDRPCHDLPDDLSARRVIRTESGPAQRTPAVPAHHRFDNREPVRVVLGEDRSEHDHVAALEVRAPVSSMASHDLPLRVGQGLREVRARSDEAQDKGGHAAHSAPPTVVIECV